MKKYKTKVRIIEAVRLLENNLEEVCRFIGIFEKNIIWKKKEDGETDDKCVHTGIYIPTADEGMELVCFGDYIIKDENLDLRVCSPEALKSNYDEISPDSENIDTQQEKITPEKIDWKEYYQNRLASLSNESIWSLGCTDSYNPHLQNVKDIEREIEAIVRTDYEEVVNKHIDTPEYFDDYILKKEDTELPEDDDVLYNEMVNLLLPEYCSAKMDDDTIQTLANEEFSRVCAAVCYKFSFDDDTYISENNGVPPFDFVCDEVKHEVLNRIKGQK